MKVFKDGSGIEWKLSMTCGSMKRVRDIAGIDVADFSEPDWFQRFFTSPATVADILWGLCQKQAEGIPVTESDFRDRLDGPTYRAAHAALIPEIADFFEYLTGSGPIIAAALRSELRRLPDKVSAAIQRIGDAESSGPVSTNAPVSAEFAQTGSPSAS